ncbi:hypothetical protein SRHO_G00133530 [Serrasalmus rhombeus]
MNSSRPANSNTESKIPPREETKQAPDMKTEQERGSRAPQRSDRAPERAGESRVWGVFGGGTETEIWSYMQRYTSTGCLWKASDWA